MCKENAMNRIIQYLFLGTILVLQSPNVYASHSIGSGIEFFYILLVILFVGVVCLVLGILKVRSVKRKERRGTLDTIILVFLFIPVVLALCVLILLLSLVI